MKAMLRVRAHAGGYLESFAISSLRVRIDELAAVN